MKNINKSVILTGLLTVAVVGLIVPGQSCAMQKEDYSRALLDVENLVSVEKVKYLIDKGAKIEAKDDEGWTALHFAVEKGNLEIVRYLVEKKLKINETDCYGWTALHYAIRKDNLDAIRKGNLEIVRYLVDNGDNTLVSALFYAIKNKNFEVVELLIEKKVEIINARNCCNNLTVLQYAIITSNLAIVTYLIDKGADVNATDTDGKTALHHAVINDNLEMVKLLLRAKGVDVSATDTNGWTALHFAAHDGKLEIVKYLVKAWEKVNKDKKENEKVNLIGIQDKKGKTALSLARKNSYYDGIAHYLVFKKTDETDTYSELETLDRPTGYTVCSWLQTIAAGVLGFVLSNNHYRTQTTLTYGALGTTIGLGLLAPLFREKFSYINMFKKNGIKTGKILLKNNWFPVGCLAAGLANKLFCKSKF